jgi:ribokinase
VPDIVVVGSINMDLVVKVQRIPVPGETIQGSDLQWIPGGKGANQAVAASRLGASVGMVGRVGNDSIGERLLVELEAQGVMVDRVGRDEQSASGTALIVVDASGENSIVISPGANGRITPADVDRAEDLIARAKIVLLQLEIPLRVVEHTIRMAARHGVMTILNPAPAGDIPAEVYREAGILVPNESELAVLTGARIEGLDTVEAAARQLLKTGLQAVVVTLGRRGACLVTGDATALVPAFPIRVVDTTAAGDAFIAGLAVARLNGKGLESAVRYANACGALAATHFGAQPSLPNAKQVETLIAQGGYKI